MRRPFLYSLFSLLYLATSAAAESKPLPTKDTTIGHLALLIAKESVTVAPDQEHLAYAAKWGDPTLEEKGVYLGNTPPDAPPAAPLTRPADKRSEMVVYRDDKPGRKFYAISIPVFSPDSQHLAYAGERQDEWHVLLDNKEIFTTDGVPLTPLVFSPDSQRLAIVHKKIRSWHVQLDGQDSAPHDAIGNGTASFSPDSKHFAYVAHDAKTWSPIVDSTPGEAFDRFGGYLWKPDSSGLAFYAARKGQRWQLFIPSIHFESKQYDGIQQGSPIFSPDATRFAFAAVTKKTWQVISNDAPGGEGGGEGPSLEQIRPESLTYLQSPDGTLHLIYLGQVDKKWHLFLDHHPTDLAFDAIGEATFTRSPDRQHYAFAGYRAGKAQVIRDGQKLAEFDLCGAGTFTFSPDSQHLACAASGGGRNKQWFAVLDGRPGLPLNSLSAGTLAFSPDSTRLAYGGQDPAGTWRLYIGPDADYRSNPYRSFFMNTRVVWKPDGTLVTLGIQKALALRIEANVPR